LSPLLLPEFLKSHLLSTYKSQVILLYSKTHNDTGKQTKERKQNNNNNKKTHGVSPSIQGKKSTLTFSFFRGTRV
jgi:hypothetical protein